MVRFVTMGPRWSDLWASVQGGQVCDRVLTRVVMFVSMVARFATMGTGWCGLWPCFLTMWPGWSGFVTMCPGWSGLWPCVQDGQVCDHVSRVVRFVTMCPGWSGLWPCVQDGQVCDHVSRMVRFVTMCPGWSGLWPCVQGGQVCDHVSRMVRFLTMGLGWSGLWPCDQDGRVSDHGSRMVRMVRFLTMGLGWSGFWQTAWFPGGLGCGIFTGMGGLWHCLMKIWFIEPRWYHFDINNGKVRSDLIVLKTANCLFTIILGVADKNIPGPVNSVFKLCLNWHLTRIQI
jgi:hypothetical protein